MLSLSLCLSCVHICASCRGHACCLGSVRAQVWYDNRADDLTKEGMLKGIEQASAFVLFLSSGVLQRPYCQMEIRHAMALKKPIVLLHGESEMRSCARPTDRRLPTASLDPVVLSACMLA